VHGWRARSSAILTGIGTVLSDDPRLDVRLPAETVTTPPRQPMRVVLDSQLRTPPAAQMFGVGGEVLILTALSALDATRAAALSARGARVESLPADADGIELTAVLDRLGELEVNELLVEAGATLAGRLLRQHLVDELMVYVAPRLLGPTARALVELPELNVLADAPGFAFMEATPVGEDLRLRLRPSPAAGA
jgi:diaminohydroxyphosphoribosylaminopyrimidine deaminase/5-amino-6-(5-phosphoribosylamino)uracil reductase